MSSSGGRGAATVQAEDFGKTLHLDRDVIKNHVRPALGKIRLNELSTLTIQKVVNGLATKYKATHHHAYVVIKEALNRAVYPDMPELEHDAAAGDMDRARDAFLLSIYRHCGCPASRYSLDLPAQLASLPK